jgi:hypothetical protein
MTSGDKIIFEMDNASEIIENCDDSITVNDFTLRGFFNPDICICPQCKDSMKIIYYEDFDAHFCPACNIWVEKKCGDPHCEYCSPRPARPLPEMES